MSKEARLLATLGRVKDSFQRTYKLILKLKQDADRSEANVLKEELEKSWEIYNNTFDECENLLAGKNEAELTKISNEFIENHNSFLKSKILVSHYTSEPTSNTLETSFFASERIKGAIPQIKIRPFSGELTEWVEFKATCNSILNDKVDETHKLQCLKESLIGEPRELVSHILPSVGAYDRALLILKNRYENTRAIVYNQLRNFSSIEKCETESASSIRRFLNSLSNLLSTMECCNIDTSTWDVMLIFDITQKLDNKSIKYWEEKQQGTKNLPNLSEFIEFLETRLTILETTESYFKFRTSNASNKIKMFDKKNPSQKVKTFLTLKEEYKCPICSSNHLVNRCSKLTTIPPRERKAIIDKLNLCLNCLYSHETKSCPFKESCKKCNRNHHTLLHFEKATANVHTALMETDNNDIELYSDNDSIDENESKESEFELCHYALSNKHVILATALVPVICNQKKIYLKTLIDQGSTANLISTNACQQLNLRRDKINIPLYGIGNVKTGQIKEKTNLSIGSLHDESFHSSISAFVVNRITEIKPLHSVEMKNWKHLKNLPLADPQFTEYGKIDLLIGASTFAEIILDGLIKGKINEPIAQKTLLGWIISGHTAEISNDSVSCNTINIPNEMEEAENLNESLQKFWEIEKVDEIKCKFSPSERLAEEITVKSFERHKDGKFIVDLPFTQDPFGSDCFGNSYAAALRRYNAIQKRFDKNQDLRKQYDFNIEEYLTLGHMELVTNNPRQYCVLPHHPVIRESSSTTKVRPVFDGSAKTSNGFSLNDRLLVGPTIQPELFDTLLKWRLFKYAISGDIEKMYRQIYVNPHHGNFQCILWKKPGTEKIQMYRLLTVTFGTASAPYQAIRCLHEVGERIKATKPEIAKIIQSQFYVDDLLCSCETIDQAITIRDELNKCLAEYGFNLRKWKASDNEILKNIEDSEKEAVLNFQSTFKALGIAWQPATDSFLFKPNKQLEIMCWTKRAVLSEIAKFFDPLGLISPMIIKSKIIMQDLWRASINWDEPIPQKIEVEWKKLYLSMTANNSITVNRWIGYSTTIKSVEMHAFCDASSMAYACAIYLKVEGTDGNIQCNLISAKAKVAPVKVLSIPRLELCGAVTLSKLVKRIQNILSIPNCPIYAYTDSMIVLTWIASHASTWKTFVANRVSEIQENIPPSCWKHVGTKENPADIASRGMPLEELKICKIWWHGPEFLQVRENKVINEKNGLLPLDKVPEHRKKGEVNLIRRENLDENDTINRFSSYTRLLRFTCYATRWMTSMKTKSRVNKKPITAEEINEAEQKLLKIVQKEEFLEDIILIKQNKCLKKNSLIKTLNPRIDATGLLRIQGRVSSPSLSNQSSAIILYGKNHLTKLIIRFYHFATQHGGVQLTLQAIREKFWILHGRTVVKRIIHSCIICFRFRKCLAKQKMAPLPTFRTEQIRPFSVVGCDYAGYFEIKTAEIRKASTSKAYVALFICLCTKAIHLELVGDLSTAEFLLAFENFIARRGIPTELHSDNGTNFIGAAKEISQMTEKFLSSKNEITKILAEKRIKFKTIPARASHMAGIWERMIGSMKFHLKRVLKNTKLTARKFDHVLKQIEACLNSRPLWAITEENDDVDVITPSHFFNFQAINMLPKPDLKHININRMDQYQYLQQIHNDFWKTWSKEYIYQLQSRAKWHTEHTNVKIGQVALIAEDNLPPSKWAMGRIVNLLPNKDGLVRVVEIKIRNTIVTRAIHKLAILPIEKELDC